MVVLFIISSIIMCALARKVSVSFEVQEEALTDIFGTDEFVDGEVD